MADDELPAWVKKCLNSNVYTFLYRLAAFIKLYVVGCISVFLDSALTHNSPKNLYKPSNWVCIVTGGAAGIGFEVSLELCRRGAHIIIASKDTTEGTEAVMMIQRAVENAKAEFIYLDLASTKSVRQFAETFLEKKLPLNLLVNNAGVMLAEHTLTEDGFELHMAVNYFGHFLLTLLLLDKLKATGTPTTRSRIVNVSSSSHFVADLDVRDLNSRTVYSCHAAYPNSKLAIIMFTQILQQELHKCGAYVTVNTVHPGIVNTRLYRHVNPFFSCIKNMLAKLLFKTPRQGADTILHVSLSADVESIGGKYFDNCVMTPWSSRCNDVENKKQLWNESCKLLRLPSSWLLPVDVHVEVPMPEPKDLGNVDRT